MTDLISRQAAIDAIYHHLPSVSITRARTMLHEVPSAQPEKRTQERTETHACDLIDRQAAIDALADMHCKSDEDGYVWIIRSDAWARIDALPSAQPELRRGGEES